MHFTSTACQAVTDHEPDLNELESLDTSRTKSAAKSWATNKMSNLEHAHITYV